MIVLLANPLGLRDSYVSATRFLRNELNAEERILRTISFSEITKPC